MAESSNLGSIASKETTSQSEGSTSPTSNTSQQSTQGRMVETRDTSEQASYEPVLIGVYGIGGSGLEFFKTCMERLLANLGHDEFQFFDFLPDLGKIEQASGQTAPSHSTDDLVDLHNREIAKIREQCRKNGKVGIVFGQRMLSRDDLKDPDDLIIQSSFWPVDTSFSFAFYYSSSSSYVVKKLLDDPSPVKLPRKKVTQKMVRGWNVRERESLKDFCITHRVPMKILQTDHGDQIRSGLAMEFVDRILLNSHTNRQRVVSEVVQAMNFEMAPSNAVVLIEGHNVLAEDGVSTEMWAEVMLKLRSWGSSGAAAIQRDKYRILRKEVGHHEGKMAREMTMDPELERLLWKLTFMRIPTVILTCGLKSIWQQVLGQSTSEDAGSSTTICPWENYSEEKQHSWLGDKIKVIGGGQTSTIAVTPEDKAAVVKALRDEYGRRVYVIGGSELDVPMLKAAGKHAFIRSPEVGEMHGCLKALLRERGGQATSIEPRAEAFRPGWQRTGSDIYDTMGLNKEERRR